MVLMPNDFSCLNYKSKAPKVTHFGTILNNKILTVVSQYIPNGSR